MFCIFVVDQSSNGVPKISHTGDLGNPEVPRAYPPRATQVVLATILNSVGANGMQMVINYVGRKQWLVAVGKLETLSNFGSKAACTKLLSPNAGTIIALIH